MINSGRLLEVKGLVTGFDTDDGLIKVVDNIDFAIGRGETLGVVGESGCGKSITSLSIMQLVPRPHGRILDGSIVYYKDEDTAVDITSLSWSSRRMRSLRGNDIAMIFQEPMTSLNPVFTVGQQIIEAIRLHQGLDKRKAKERAIEMLQLVGIPEPAQRVDEYPHQFSGGMRQRSMIAMALSCDPKLLIADEPTTALDVTIEAQILELIKKVQREMRMAVMIITHDLGVIGEMAARVIVMYCGKIVESALTDTIFYESAHPYTAGLLRSKPMIGRKEKLTPIEGSVPALDDLPSGCYFAPRCPKAMDICSSQEPAVTPLSENHGVKCWLYGEGGAQD